MTSRRYWRIKSAVECPRAEDVPDTSCGNFQGADLLIAADCTAYAYGNLHREFMQGKITLIGCPKLDSVDYSEKLSVIIGENDIQNITLTRMEVPCCGGLELAVKRALAQCGKEIPLEVVTISLDGKILSRREER